LFFKKKKKNLLYAFCHQIDSLYFLASKKAFSTILFSTKHQSYGHDTRFFAVKSLLISIK